MFRLPIDGQTIIAKHKLPNDWCIYYYKTNKLFDGIFLQIIS